MSAHTQGIAALTVFLTIVAELALVGLIAICYLLRDKDRP